MAQAIEDEARHVGAGIDQELSRHDLEQIAAHECLLGAPHQRGIFARGVVAFGRASSRGVAEPIGRWRGRPRQPRCGAAGDLELVAMQRRLLAHVVDDQDFVRQVQHEVALVGRARQAQGNWLELEYEVVAERAVEPEMLVIRAGEQLAEGAQNRKNAGLPAARLLGKAGRALADLAVDAVVARVPDVGRREAGQMAADRSEQQPPALVERLDGKAVPARRQHQRRVDKPHVPARIAPGELEAR